MIHIAINVMNGECTEKDFKEGITPAEIAGMVPLSFPVLACRVNNQNKRLDEPLVEDCTLELLDLRDNYANMAYQSTLSFLYIAAVHEVLGKEAHVVIANSLSKGLYTIVKKGYDEKDVEAISKKMHQWVKEDIPFEKLTDQEEFEKFFHNGRNKERMRLLSSSFGEQEAQLYCFQGQIEMFYLELLPSAGYLTMFELRKYRNGILLRYPQQSDPLTIPPYQEQKLLYDAFKEETQWEHLLHIDYAADLNESMCTRAKQVIMVCEALHEKKIAEIANDIVEKKKRIILIAGPSSSGKTSFAERLCIQLQVLGSVPLYLGTDDYFIDRKDMVKEKDGTYDFEALSAVDLGLFEKQMNALLKGETVDLPKFNFITGEKEYGSRITSISSHTPIVIEGIHALDPLMTTGIPDEEKYRIYISPLTSLNIDSHHRVPTTDARMLRRIVRDYRTRGRSASQSIMDWPSVRKGEEKWIFPYNDTADVFFNSSLIYELCVLRKYAEPLLKDIKQNDPAYPEAQRMLEFMRFFVMSDQDMYIANNSILREFIGGSVLVD